jgi:alpha-glucuronidase
MFHAYILETGETVIQHIYDTHFGGVEKVEQYIEKWVSIIDKLNKDTYELVLN